MMAYTITTATGMPPPQFTPPPECQESPSHVYRTSLFTIGTPDPAVCIPVQGGHDYINDVSCEHYNLGPMSYDDENQCTLYTYDDAGCPSGTRPPARGEPGQWRPFLFSWHAEFPVEHAIRAPWKSHHRTRNTEAYLPLDSLDTRHSPSPVAARLAQTQIHGTATTTTDGVDTYAVTGCVAHV